MANTTFSTARSYAEQLDEQDTLRTFRSQFLIPTKADLKRQTLAKSSTQSNTNPEDEELSIYLCGNSLGLQPRHLYGRVREHLDAWATKGVFGHFRGHEDSDLAPFLHIDEQVAEKLAPVVGALKSEVAPMETLTANLHLLMASFYRPTKERYKIILEGKAFPSDHYAIESQIKHHNLDPSLAMIILAPEAPSVTLTTASILSTITAHASSTALILLPGIQYYTGQYFDVKTITAHAHSLGITIGWDMAHAAGNVPLKLHDWDVDFAAWCNYKYINAGPGAVGGLFVHERHGRVNMSARERGEEPFRPRLSGWWGGEKGIRFMMGKDFVPIPGAAGFQVGNPCAIALVALLASLEILSQTSMTALRQKSIRITSYLEALLSDSLPLTSKSPADAQRPLYFIITPSSPEERGAQLSVRVLPGMLDSVMEDLEANGVVVDERKPDVVRVAPTPLYNTFQECWEFVRIFKEACVKAEKGLEAGKGINGDGSVMDKHGGTE